MCTPYSAAMIPTMYFIGVTTSKSSIMEVFPKWAKALGIDAVMKGVDFTPHASPKEYREVVTFIKNDEKSLGALVTTHKIDLYNSCKDLFDYLDPFAVQLSEISCISKRDGKLCGHAKDPISSGLALEHFVPRNFWKKHQGDVLLLGAGGSSLAMSLYYSQKDTKDVPGRIIIANRSLPRLESAEKILKGLNSEIQFDFVHNPTPKDNDTVMRALKPYSLVVNATGLGKDRPGSPVTKDGVFPKNGLVWEINYRGELLFMQQALTQSNERGLTMEDGWIYFIHGWTQVISEVFQIPIEGEILGKLSKIAKS